MAGLKIIVCGPSRSGKTALSDFLSGHTEALRSPNAPYSPTAGCRIMEYEKAPGNSGAKVNIELWDVSGDQSYEGCWPAILKDADGVLLVYNPEIPAHEPEVGIWYDQFVKGGKLSDEQCLAFSHRTQSRSQGRARPPPKLSHVTVAATTFDSAKQVSSAFDDFLRTVHALSQKKERRK